MMLRLLRRNALLPLHQTTQTELPFLFVNPISNANLAAPRTDLFPFPVFFFFSVASNLRPESPKIKEPILDFFHSYGFTDPQIERLISVGKCPSIRSTEIIKPKFEHLLSFGFSPSELVRAISNRPDILTASLKERIRPNLKILETIFGSKTDIIKAIIRSPRLLTHNLEKNVIPSINILRENGIPTDTINRLFLLFPLVLEKDCNVMIEVITKLKGLGMSPSTLAFVNGMNIMAMYKKETWERKVELYRSLGWSEKDILSVFSTQPTCLAISDDKIKEKMKFFKEKLQWDSAILAKQPVFLLYGLEGRIMPRCAVLSVLAERKLWNGSPSLFSLFRMAEKKFEGRFVDKYEKEVPQVIDAYQGKIDFVGFESMDVVGLKS